MTRTAALAAAALGAVLTLTTPAAAQAPAGREHPGHSLLTEDQRAVAAVVHDLFDAMRSGDSATVRRVFHSEARMITSFRRAGVPQVAIEEDLGGFVEMVGTPHDQVFDERIWGLLIRTDGDFGMAWMNYAFFLGPLFSHCGIDLMEMVRTTEGRKIINLADTRQREGCEIPESLR